MPHLSRLSRVAIFLLATLAACSRGSAGDELQQPRTALYSVNVDGKRGLIDSTGRMVVKPQFEQLWSMAGDRAPAAVGDRWGYVDRTGRLVVSPQYKMTYGFDNGFAAVQSQEGRWGFIDEAGQVKIAPQFDDVGVFTDSHIAPVAVGNRWGFIGEDGKFIVNPQFDMALSFDHSGLAAVEVSKRWGYVDRKGQFVINPQFDDAGNFASGLAPVKVGERWGFIDNKGTLVIAPQFDQAREFTEGVAAVRIGDRAGYIGPDGKYVINPQFERTDPFDNGIAGAQLSGRCGFIDKAGKWVINPQFKSCSTTNGPLLMVQSDTMPTGAYAYLTLAGREVARDRPPASEAAIDASLLGGYDTQKTPEPGPNAKRVVVRMIGDDNGYRLEPRVIHIHSGDQVSWRMVSGGPHNIGFDRTTLTAAAAAAIDRDMPQKISELSSPMLMNPGETYSVTFAGVPPGTYAYYCIPHLAMGEKATIVVDP